MIPKNARVAKPHYMGGIISRLTHLNNLQKQMNMAKDLVALIKEEYHLK